MSSIVLVSLESTDGSQCVDIFERDDGSFGFEQYRAEFDGSSCWQSLSRYSHLSFASGGQALHAARERVPWLNQVQARGW
jgi:hypothetical protein